MRQRGAASVRYSYDANKVPDLHLNAILNSQKAVLGNGTVSLEKDFYGSNYRYKWNHVMGKVYFK